MKRFADLPKERRIQMGENSRNLMELEFDKKRVVSETIAVLRL